MNNWPIDPPTEANPVLGNVPSPMLPIDGGYAENRRDFASKAFHLFSAVLIRKIQDVNDALRKFHLSGGTPTDYALYQQAAQKYREFINHPVVSTGLDPVKDPLPERVFAIEDLQVETRLEGDYCVAVTFTGAVVFSACGPAGESSSSSSSRRTIPPIP